MLIYHYRILLACCLLALTSTAEQSDRNRNAGDSAEANKYQAVVCLLPGRVRKLGGRMTYIERRKPTETTAVDCEIRGGEYTAYDRANYQEALAVWKQAAQNGDPKAQTYVGEILEKRLGQPDYKKAAHWYSMAAEQGYKRGMRNLAYLYEKGLGVERNLPKALNLWRQASGLKDDLVFKTDLLAVRSASNARIAALTQQLDRRNQDAAILQRRLENQRAELDRANALFAQSQSDVLKLEQTLQESRASNGHSDAAAIARLEEELQARNENIEDQKYRIALLENDLDAQNARLQASMKAAKIEEARLLKAVTDITESRDALLDNLAQKDHQILALEAQVSLKKQELDQNAVALAESQSRIESLRKRMGGNADQSQEQETRLAALENQLLASREKFAGKEREFQQLNETYLKQKEEFSDRLKALEIDRTTLSETLARNLAETASQNASHTAELRLRDQQVEELREKMRALRGEIASLEETNSDLNYAVAEKRAAGMQQQSDQLAELKAQLASNKTVLSEKNKEIETLNEQWLEAEKKLADMRDQWEGLVDNRDTAVVALSSMERRLIEEKWEYDNTKQKLATIRREKERFRDENARLKERMRTSESDRESMSAELQAYEKRYNRDLAQKNRQIADLETKLSSQQWEMDRLLMQRQNQNQLLSFRSADSAPEPKRPIKKSILPAGLDPGKYSALIIANSSYDYIQDLATPMADATALRTLLEERYGFTVNLKRNLTLEKMSEELSLLKQHAEDENVLVYYAGHGKIDEQGDSYWLPIDYDPSRPLASTAISADQVSRYINMMSSAHVLLVVDSCYAGAMFRNAGVTLKKLPNIDRRLVHFLKNKSRNALTSGGEGPVLDMGNNRHSVFANAFIDVLSNSSGILYGEGIHFEVQNRVRNASRQYNLDQNPRFGSLADAGDSLGQFVFVPI